MYRNGQLTLIHSTSNYALSTTHNGRKYKKILHKPVLHHRTLSVKTKANGEGTANGISW